MKIKKLINSSLFIITLLACAAMPASQAYAQSAVLYRTSFDTDQGYTLGPIEGQDGWGYEGDVQNSVVQDGDQALHIEIGRAHV